jgi:tight adherence protein C
MSSRLRRHFLVTCIAVAQALSLGVAGPASADDGLRIIVNEVDASEFPQIRVVAAVTDASGKPVRGLSAAQLLVSEGGAPQNASVDLASEVSPVALALVLDTSGSMAGRPFTDAKAAMTTLIRGLSQKDHATVVTFAATVRVPQALTTSTERLVAATNAAVATGDTAIYDALATAVTALEGAPDRARKAIVLLTDGIDTASRQDRAAVLASLATAGLPVIVVALGGNLDRPALASIAGAVPGGRFIEAPRSSDLAAIYSGLVEQLLTQYSVSYRSGAPVRDLTTLSVELALRRDGAIVALTGTTYRVPVGRGIQTPIATLAPATASGAAADPVVVAPRVPVSPLPPELIGLLGAATVLTLLLWIGEIANRYPARQRRRLEQFVRSLSLTTSGHSKRRSIVQRVLVPTLRAAGRPLLRVTPVGMLRSTRERLQSAGEPLGLGPVEFFGIRAGLAIGVAIVTLAVVTRITGNAASAPHGLLGGALLGFALPGLVIDHIARQRKAAIRRALPAALDMLALSAEAGLSFDGAIGQVAHRWENALSDEFRRLLVEFQMGRERRYALRELAQRSGVAELGRFANAVVQADSLGVPLSRVLHEQSSEIRLRRRQRAEELARKAPVKMLFPMVALIFPALFVVILGPAVPRLLEAFGTLQ